MAITLKPVDVAVIGLGAAGGVAVLPLARAGLEVAGLEAGTWMDPHRDYRHADEIFNNCPLAWWLRRSKPSRNFRPFAPRRQALPVAPASIP